MARALVTGANGFAGAAICRQLLAQGWTLRGSVRSATATVPEGVEKSVSGDIDDTTDWAAALHDADAVVHCAALATPWAAPDAYRRANVDATRHVLQWAADHGLLD